MTQSGRSLDCKIQQVDSENGWLRSDAGRDRGCYFDNAVGRGKGDYDGLQRRRLQGHYVTDIPFGDFGHISDC